MIKALLLGVVAVLVVVTEVMRSWPDSYLHIITCDVGQGDAILLSHGFSQLLIDGGVDGELVLNCLDNHLPWGDRTLELVVATHADADHIGGLVAVLERFTIDTLLINGEHKETDVFKQFSSLVQTKAEQGMEVISPGLGDTWQLGQSLIVTSLFSRVGECSQIPFNYQVSETTLQDTVCPESTKVESSNDRSIVLNARYYSVSILLMGDLELAGEQSLLRKGLLEKTTIVKAGHHGAKTSSGAGFIAATRPEIVLISSGKNNRFGHPSPEVMSRFDAVDSTILRTDQQGTIELLSDGDHAWLNPEQNLNLIARISHIISILSTSN